MRSGELRKRIEIQEAIEARDDYGAAIPFWQTIYRAWAKVEDLSGRELHQADQISATSSTRFTIRYRREFATGLTEKMTILFQGKVYDITTISDLEQAHREIQILAAVRPANRAR